VHISTSSRIPTDNAVQNLYLEAYRSNLFDPKLQSPINSWTISRTLSRPGREGSDEEVTPYSNIEANNTPLYKMMSRPNSNTP
jgi:hypothetical protein